MRGILFFQTRRLPICWKQHLPHAIMGVQSLGFSFPQGPVPSQLAQTPLNHTDWHWRNKRVPSAWKKTSSASTRLRWPLHPSKPMRGAQPLPSTPKMRLQSDSIIFPTPGSAGKRKVNPNESGPAPNGLTGRMKPEASTKKGHVLMLSEWTKDMVKGYYEDSAERAKAFVRSIRPSAGDVQLLSIFRRAVQLYSFTGVWSWIFLES